MTSSRFAQSIGLGLALLLVAAQPALGATSESASPTTWTGSASAHGGELTAVSCVSATRCFAVGKYYRGRIALIEQWHGTRWTVMPGPNPGSESSLAGVSCTSAGHCVAVGVFYAGQRRHALVETWNGTGWRYEPRIGDADTLTGVSCSSDASCVAVGVAPDGNHAAAEVWNGTRWSMSTLPAIPKGWADGLSGVSCVSATHCVAVGTLAAPAIPTGALVETWDGNRWTITPSPSNGNVRARALAAVSCSSTASCLAVGGSGSGETPTLSERWDGTSWSVVPTPPVGGQYVVNGLSGVSCVRATSCVAVGALQNTYVTHEQILRTLVERWNGVQWSVTPTPYPGPKVFSALDAVSCTPEHCAAVGYYYSTGFAAQTLGLSGSVPRRTVKVSWTASEDARLRRIAAYLHLSPAGLQKRAVYGTAYLAGFGSATPAPVTLPPTGCCATYTTVWAQSELGILDSVRVKYGLSSLGATRFSVYLLSYLLALGGH